MGKAEWLIALTGIGAIALLGYIGIKKLMGLDVTTVFKPLQEVLIPPSQEIIKAYEQVGIVPHVFRPNGEIQGLIDPTTYFIKNIEFQLRPVEVAVRGITDPLGLAIESAKEKGSEEFAHAVETFAGVRQELGVIPKIEPKGVLPTPQQFIEQARLLLPVEPTIGEPEY